jgi:hypothetical protein
MIDNFPKKCKGQTKVCGVVGKLGALKNRLAAVETQLQHICNSASHKEEMAKMVKIPVAMSWFFL